MATLSGTAGNAVIAGTADADTIDAAAGNGKIYSGLGSDAVYGDLIADFSAGDTLDLREFTRTLNGAPTSDAVHIAGTAVGSVVSVKMGSAFYDIVTLQDVHWVSIAGMLADGLILA